MVSLAYERWAARVRGSVGKGREDEVRGRVDEKEDEERDRREMRRREGEEEQEQEYRRLRASFEDINIDEGGSRQKKRKRGPTEEDAVDL